MASSKFSMKTLLELGRGDASSPRRVGRLQKSASRKPSGKEDQVTTRSPSSSIELNQSPTRSPGMFNFNLPANELPTSMFGNVQVTFDCKCRGELFSDILVIGHECLTHQGKTTHNHAIYLEALRHEWKR
jgi:hypothetical protein